MRLFFNRDTSHIVVDAESERLQIEEQANEGPPAYPVLGKRIRYTRPVQLTLLHQVQNGAINRCITLG